MENGNSKQRVPSAQLRETTNPLSLTICICKEFENSYCRYSASGGLHTQTEISTSRGCKRRTSKECKNTLQRRRISCHYALNLNPCLMSLPSSHPPSKTEFSGLPNCLCYKPHCLTIFPFCYSLRVYVLKNRPFERSENSKTLLMNSRDFKNSYCWPNTRLNPFYFTKLHQKGVSSGPSQSATAPNK